MGNDGPPVVGGGPPRMAYFISSYGPPEQLRRLLRTLRAADGTAHLVVHHDVFQHPVDPAVVEEFGGHLLSSPYPIVWGDLSLDRTRERVYRWVLEHLDFDWLVLLSEQDYPVAPPAQLAARLRASSADAVIETERLDQVVDPGVARDYRRRYLHQYASLPTWLLPRRNRPAATVPAAPGSGGRSTGGAVRWLLSLVEHLGFVYPMPAALGLPAKIGYRARLGSPFSARRPLHVHSAWFALSRRGVQRLVELMDADPRLVRYFERTVIPVEAITATLLCNAADVVVENVSLHHIRWSDPASGRPDVFTEADLPELLGSGAYFARKVSLAHPSLLDRLDEHVLPHPRQPHRVESLVDGEVS